MRAFAVASIVISAIFILLFSELPAVAQQPECRETRTRIGNSELYEVRRMCRDASGTWRPAPEAPTSSADIIESGVMPASFRGRAIYRGPYDAQIVDAPRGRPARGLGGLLQQAAGGTRRQLTGIYTIMLNFEPNGIVTGNASGTTLPVNVRLSGTRQGNRCRLTASPGNSTYDGTCTPSTFNGIVTSSPQETQGRFTISFDLAASEFVDSTEEAAIRRREAEESAERARLAQIEAQRLATVEAARVAAQPRVRGDAATPTAVQNRQTTTNIQRNGSFSSTLRWALQQDAGSWRINRIKPNSESALREQSGFDRPTRVFRMDFLYTDDAPGWIEGYFNGADLISIRYADNQTWAHVRTDETRERAWRDGMVTDAINRDAERRRQCDIYFTISQCT